MANTHPKPAKKRAVKPPAKPPEQVRYEAHNKLGIGVETLSFVQLRQRGKPEHLAAVQRLSLLMFVLYTEGSSTHMVDFVHYLVQPKTLVVVQPGQLHQFALHEGMQGQLLVVDPQFMLPERLAQLKPLLSGQWPVCSQLDSATAQELLSILAQLAADTIRHAQPALLEALARQRLYTWLLLLRISWNRHGDAAVPERKATHLVKEFEGLLEKHYPQQWTVQQYARKLGYAEKTLTRACQAYAGISAKAAIDARLILEAKRLLAHSEDTIDTISARLGFDDSSSMIRFFKRLEDVTPAIFRLRLRQISPP